MALLLLGAIAGPRTLSCASYDVRFIPKLVSRYRVKPVSCQHFINNIINIQVLGEKNDKKLKILNILLSYAHGLHTFTNVCQIKFHSNNNVL